MMNSKKIIPNSWELKRFTDFCDLKHGFQFREEHFVQEGIPVVKIGSLVDGAGIREDNLTFVKPESATQFDGFKLCEGDILMALTGGTLGKVCVFPKREGIYLQNYRVGNFIPRNIAAKEYILQLLQSYIVQDRILNLVNEAAQPNFGKQDFDKIKVYLPPLPEQKAIAKVLSTADAAIHTTEKLIVQKELRKKWLMQQLLTGKKRLKGFEGEWKEVKLGGVCDLINGMAFKPEEWSNFGLPIIRIQNLNGSKEFNYYDKEVDKRHLVTNGDLLFAWSGSRGTSFGAFRWFGEIAVLNQHIFNVYPKNGLDKDFAFQLLRWLTIEIERKAHGSAGLVHVTKKQLENELMRFPKAKEEQTAIAQVLQAADKEISLLKAKAEKLREQKKGLMQVLLTGKKRLNQNLQD
jgi:type I restriction enzyme S subunit